MAGALRGWNPPARGVAENAEGGWSEGGVPPAGKPVSVIPLATPGGIVVF